MYSPKVVETLLKHKYADDVKGIVFFFLWKIYFLLVLALDSKGIINTLKGSLWNALTL